MSQIAARAYGRAADWPAVWWANRRQVPGPDPRRPAAGPAELTPGAAVACPRRPGRHRFGTTCPAAPAAATAAPAGPARASAQRRRLGRGELVGHRGVRVRRNWAASTGNGFYGGLQLSSADLARLRRRPVRFLGEPRHPGPADRRGPRVLASPASAPEPCGARGCMPGPRAPPACTGLLSRRRQAGGAVPAAHPAVIPAMNWPSMSPLVRGRGGAGRCPGPSARVAARRECLQPTGAACPAHAGKRQKEPGHQPHDTPLRHRATMSGVLGIPPVPLPRSGPDRDRSPVRLPLAPVPPWAARRASLARHAHSRATRITAIRTRKP